MDNSNDNTKSDDNPFLQSSGNHSFEFFDAVEDVFFCDIMLHQQQQSFVGSSSTSSDTFATSTSTEDATATKPLHRQSSIVGELKGRVDANQKKLRAMAHKQRQNLERKVHNRRKKLKKLLADPAVVLTMDKISFVMGVLTIMVIEGVMLLAPSQMGLLYTSLLIPLMVARYILYRADLFHYFMYDFCYFSQVLLLVHMYKHPDNIKLAKCLFSISNGPLALAVVMWRNSLVFHSMDKMTSMFIHVLPSLVMFCRRWGDHLLLKEFSLYEEMDGTMTSNIIDFWWNPFCWYALWQTIYLIKTEVYSKKKLMYNASIMTSLRWMTRKKNSTSYKLLSVFGEHNQLQTFVLVQAVYTLLTFLVVPLLWYSIWLHSLYLLVIFVVALVNGAQYYFHVFAVRYIEKIRTSVSDSVEPHDTNDTDESVKG